MCTIKCYSTLNKGILPFPTMWMGLGNIMLTKSSQTQRWILHVESKNHQIINLETVERYLQELEEMRRSYSKGRKFESESEVTQSCPTLCDPMDCSLPASSVCGIFQARVLEWVAISFSRRSSQARDRTRVSCIAGRRFTIWATREARESLNYVIISGDIIQYASLIIQQVKNPPAVQETQETQVWSLGWDDTLEEEMAPHSSALAWEIPWTGEPAELRPIGSQRVGHDWATEQAHYSAECLELIILYSLHTHVHNKLGERKLWEVVDMSMFLMASWGCSLSPRLVMCTYKICRALYMSVIPQML